MRDVPGAEGPLNCTLCRPGYYCPNDTVNTQGIPCQETYECPPGASLEIDCRSGHYCVGITGIPPICPGGYYCPNATDTPIPCYYPEYCPEGSNMTLKCPLGYRAIDHPGVRYDISISCEICPNGTYGNHTEREVCLICPAGYYCPAGTGHGDSNPCPVGSYCPLGSAQPQPCPRGMYGKLYRAQNYGDCALCPAGYYNDLLGQKACRPCGTSSTSAEGSATCTCLGSLRSFQPSDGSCKCLSGHIYYNEADIKEDDGNSDIDCQPIVDTRCGIYQTRISSTRECVDASTYDCSVTCVDSGGVLNIDYGM